jgi:uroporphyrinogen-III synthase
LSTPIDSFIIDPMGESEPRCIGIESGKALAGLAVLSLESRRADEMAELIRRHGGTPISAPSMREVPLQANQEALDFLHRLENGEVDIVLLLTGVGTRTLVAAVAGECSPQRFAELLRHVQVVARGPKPVAALRELGLTPNVLVPEPNTWREILATLDERLPVNGRRVAIQEYGRTNEELLDGLRERGAEVSQVRIYRWDLPEDVEPLEDAVRRTASGDVDIMLFTSARQVDNFLEIARRMNLQEQVVAASARILIASIGPVCSEALRANRLPVDLEPAHPKMGQLVRAVSDRGRRLLEQKRALLTGSDPSRT